MFEDKLKSEKNLIQTVLKSEFNLEKNNLQSKIQELEQSLEKQKRINHSTNRTKKRMKN